ncbi:hypothetical protein [Enterovirga sp.]|uniref:hypothetical protein n=1 Tax=Enterovirga sp. TaxID=2026350 RepID=UPI00262D6380|nr:hypothetical protein [Enterovirga sp.]MDB5590361.1 hypothetical protein [Enterovirga sp.]
MSVAALSLLGARMLATAAIVLAASLAVERVGPFLGAIVATLPVSAGPAYLFLSLDHPPSFVAGAALTSLLSVGATAAFVTAYAAVAWRCGTVLALLAGLAGWAVSLFGLSHISWTGWTAFASSVGLTVAAMVATAPARRQVIPKPPSATALQIAIRACTVMALVVATTLIGQALGPGPAGYAAMVPVVFVSLIALLQPRMGGPAVAGLMSHALAGMLGYGPALLLLHLAAEPLGSGWALILALATCLAWNGALIVLRRALG